MPWYEHELFLVYDPSNLGIYLEQYGGNAFV